MNAVMTMPTGVLTMSSKEIAELTGKRHGDVIRDIRVMLEDLGDDANLRHVSEEADKRGYTALIALPKDLTITLISGYNVVLRKRIVDRWLELEEEAAQAKQAAAPKFHIPTSLGEALMLAGKLEQGRAELAIAVEQKDRELAVVVPKAAALEQG